MFHLLLIFIICTENIWAKPIFDTNGESLLFSKTNNDENIAPFITVENYVTQRLDNFDIQNDKTFEQVSYINE